MTIQRDGVSFIFICDICRIAVNSNKLTDGWFMLYRVQPERKETVPDVRHACPNCAAIVKDLLLENGVIKDERIVGQQ